MSSSEEPLLQISDLVAFCINRSTHLSMKATRTDIDNGFLEIVGDMRIRSDKLEPMIIPPDFTPEDFDRFHVVDRLLKGLK
jgi:hypothetical protein